MTEAKTMKADPALGFSYQVVLDKDARRTIVFQTHVANEANQADIDALLDKMGKAADRQIAWYDLQQAREDLEGQQRVAKSLVMQMETMDQLAQARYESSDRKGPWDPEKLPPAEKQARHNLRVSLERYREGIEKAQNAIDRCTPLVNGAASHVPDSGSNRHSGQPGS